MTALSARGYAAVDEVARIVRDLAPDERRAVFALAERRISGVSTTTAKPEARGLFPKRPVTAWPEASPEEAAAFEAERAGPACRKCGGPCSPGAKRCRGCYRSRP